MHISDKIIIVTGASSGIGEATAKLLSQKGGIVVLAARNAAKLTELANILPRSLAVLTDMLSEDAIHAFVKKTFDTFGKIDILINSAGRGYDAPLETTDITTYKEIFNLNVIGPLIAMQSVIPIMKRQGEGSIINISSGTSLGYYPNMSAYSSTKRAINALSLTSRIELASSHINVGVVYPYMTNTNFETNTIGSVASFTEITSDPQRQLPPADPPELVATKILEAIETEVGEIYVHDWMKRT